MWKEAVVASLTYCPNTLCRDWGKPQTSVNRARPQAEFWNQGIVNMKQDSHTLQNAVWWLVYRNVYDMIFVDMFEELQKDTIRFLLSLWVSLCLCTQEQFCSQWTNIHEILQWRFLLISVTQIQVCLKSDKTDSLQKELHTLKWLTGLYNGDRLCSLWGTSCGWRNNRWPKHNNQTLLTLKLLLRYGDKNGAKEPEVLCPANISQLV